MRLAKEYNFVHEWSRQTDSRGRGQIISAVEIVHLSRDTSQLAIKCDKLRYNSGQRSGDWLCTYSVQLLIRFRGCRVINIDNQSSGVFYK